jgi:hypothetical protein
MFGITAVMRSVSTGRPDTSVFHGLSFGKMRQPPCIVPGPGLPPPELLVLLVAPPDEVLEPAPPELDDELASPLEDDDASLVVSPPPPQATTIPTPIPMATRKTTKDRLMMRS